MALCEDSRLTYLNSKGYNVVLVPRQGIEPLDVLGRDNGGITRLGTMSEIWTSSAPVPRPSAPQLAVGIAGTKTDDLKLSLGLSLLSNILNGMGAVVNLPKLAIAYQRARTVQYTFGNVVAVSIDPFAIGNYLSKGDLQLDNPFVDRYFEHEGTSAYFISEALKSDSVAVSSKDDHNTSVSVDLPAIQQMVGANVAVTSNRSDSSELSYKGSAMLTFGFKVFGILHTAGKWSVRGVKPSADIAFVPGEGEAPGAEPVLFGSGSLIRLGSREKAPAAR